MGDVYLARDTRLHRDVAIKVVKEASSEHTGISRLRREAQAVAALSHPSVCAIFDVGDHDGRPYLVMELLEGETLQARLTRGSLTLPEVLDRGIALADGLEAAHEKGLIHRDIKPGNVFLTKRGDTKLLDFGLARPVNASEVTTHVADAHTGPGSAAGTVAYMSPEQLRGEPLDRRSDLFSLGLLLCEMATGHRPFGGATTHAMAAAILASEPTDPLTLLPALPPQLKDVILKALEKDREYRYQSAADIRADLKRLQKTGGASARDGMTPRAEQLAGVTLSQSVSASSFSTRRMVVAGVGLVVLLSVGSWWVIRTLRSSSVPDTSRSTVSRSLSRLTFDHGLQTEITWSPDNRFIAYASDRAGNFDLWVQPVDGGAATQLTKSPAHDRQPTWSPDGTTIVFRSDRAGGGLFAVPARGGAERQLTSFGVQPKWAPDGSQILFINTDFFAAVPQMFTVRLDGTPPQPILQTFLRTMRVARSWNWYSDSKRISIVGKKPGEKDEALYTVPLAGEGGQGPAVLKNTGEVGNWGDFDWSPSGSTLYVDCGGAGARGVCKLEVDRAAMKLLSTQRIGGGAEYQATPSLSRDGRRLAVTMGRLSSRLWIFPLDAASGRVTGNGEPVSDPNAHMSHSSLSRDEKSLAYVLSRVGSNREELWAADLTRAEHLQLTNDDQIRYSVQFSRDGKKLAYLWMRRRTDGRFDQALAIRGIDTQEEQLVSTPQARSGEIVYPSDWSPDDKWVLGSSILPHDPVFSLTLWPLAAAPRAQESLRTLAWSADMDLWGGRFSPDGRWISFLAVHRNQPGAATVFVMPSEGGDARQWTPVTSGNDWADKPKWSPDGRLVYFIRYTKSFFNLWARRFDQARGQPVGEPFQVTHFDNPGKQISIDFELTDIDVSRTRLVLTIMEQTGNVWLLDNVDQ